MMLLTLIMGLVPATAWADDDTQSYDTLFHYEVTSSTSLSTTAIAATYGTIAANETLTASTQTNVGGSYALSFGYNSTYLTITLADSLADSLADGDTYTLYYVDDKSWGAVYVALYDSSWNFLYDTFWKNDSTVVGVAMTECGTYGSYKEYKYSFTYSEETGEPTYVIFFTVVDSSSSQSSTFTPANGATYNSSSKLSGSTSNTYTLQQGDSIIMYGNSGTSGACFALCTTTTRSTDITTTGASADKTKEALTYTIPSGSSLIGASTIYVFRGTGNNTYFCGATIIRAKSETTSTSGSWAIDPATGTLTSPLTTITLTSSDSISAVNDADSCTVTITKDGSAVEGITPTLSLGDVSDDGHCYTATVSFGDGIETNGSYTITIPAGALMTITEKETSSGGSSDDEATTTAEGDDETGTTTDEAEYDTTFSEKMELTYTISIADPTVTVARQVSTAKSLADGDTLLVLTFDQTVTLAESTTATLTSSDTSDGTSYDVALSLTTDGDSAVVTLQTAISTDDTYTLTISSGAFTTTNWSSDELTYTITVASKVTFYLVADGDNAQTDGITITPASGTTSLTLDNIVITLPAAVTYYSDNAITADNATASVSTDGTSLTIALSSITAGDTITITIPAGAITYTSDGTTYTNAAATLTYTVPAVTVVDSSKPSTYSWDFDDSSWSGFSVSSGSSATENGLTVYAGSNGVSVSSYSQTIDGTSHSGYLNLGGGGKWSSGTFSNYGVSFQVTGPCTIYVGACSSNDNTARDLVLSTSSGTAIDTLSALGYDSTISELTYTYTGSSDNLYLYTASSGLRLYYITIVYATSTALDFKAITPDPAETQQSMSSIQLTYDNSILYAGQGDSGISVTKKTGTDGTAETVTSSYTITSSDDNAYHYLTVSFDEITYTDEDTTYVTLTIPEKTFCGSDYVSTAAVDTTFTIAKAYLTPTAVTPESGSTTSLLNSVVLTFDSLAYYDSTAGTITVTRSDEVTVSDISVSPSTSADADTTITISFDKIETEDITVTVTIPAGCLTTAAGTANKDLTYTYTIQEETETKDYSWNFSNWTAGTVTSGTTTDGLTVTASSAITIDSNTKSLNGTTYTQRLKLPNGGVLSFEVERQCIVTVVAQSASSSYDREYVVSLNGDSIGAAIAYGSTITSSTHLCSTAGTVTITNTGGGINYYEIYLTYIDGLALTNVVPEDNSTVESLSKIYIYYDEAIQLTDQPRATYRVDGTLTGNYGTDVTLTVSSSNNQCLVATVPTTAAESGKTKTAKLTIRSYSVANSDSTSLNEDPIVLDYTLQFLPLNIVEVSPDTTTNPSFVKYVYVTYDSENDLTLNSSKSVSVTVNGSPYSGTVKTSVSGKKLKIALSNKVNTNGDVVVITLPDSIVSDNNESFNTEDSLTYNIDAYGELCSFYFTTSLNSNYNYNGVSETNTSTDAVANGCTGYWQNISHDSDYTLTLHGKNYYRFSNATTSYVKIEVDGGFQPTDSAVVYMASGNGVSKDISYLAMVDGSTKTFVSGTSGTDSTLVASAKLSTLDASYNKDTLTIKRNNGNERFHGITIYRLGITDPSVTIETDYTERYVNESVEITSELTDFDSEDETYQWYSFHGTDSTAYSPTAIDGATDSNYSYTATTDNDTTSYVVKVTYTTESGTDTTLVSNVLTIITSGYAKPVINTYISGALTEADGENNDTTTYVTSQSSFTVIITSRMSSDNVTYYYKTSTTGFDTEYAADDGWTKGDTISMSISTTAITYLSVAAVYGSGDDQVVTYSFALYVPSGGSWDYDDSNVITVLYTDLDDMDSAPLGVTLTYTLSGTAYNANSWGLMTLSIEDDYENAGYYYSNIVTLDADTVIAEIEGTTYITVTLADVTGLTATGSPYEITVYANMEPEIVLTSVTDSEGTHTSDLTSYYTISSDGTTYTMKSGVTAVKFQINMPTEITTSETNTDTYHIFYTINAPHPTWDTTTEGDKSVYYGSYSTSGSYSYSTSGQDISRSLTSYVKAVYYKAATVSDTAQYSKPSNTQLAAFVMPSNYVMTLQTGDSLRAGAEWFITNAQTQQYYWSGTTSATNPKASETTSTTESSTTESCDTLLRVTWGGTGDYYNSKKGIWGTIREDTKTMMSSQIGDYYTDCEGNKDATNEPYTDTVGGDTFTNIYKNGTGSVFYSDTLTNPNTFDIPVTGSYMKIEPRQDGEVSVIVRQNGIITESTDNFPKNLRKRKIYVSDETGAPLDSTLTAFISPDALQESGIYNTHTNSGWEHEEVNDSDNLEFYQMLAYYRWKRGQGNTDVPPAVSDSARWTDDQKLAAAKFWFGTIDGEQIADSTKTSQLIGGSYTNQTRKDSCAMYQKSHNELYKDNKGWLLMSRAFVRYSFPVEAGKAYFLSGNTTKIGPCAVEFHPRRSGETYTNFTSGRLLQLADSTETTTASTALPTVTTTTETYGYGQSKFQLLNRTFYKNGWTSIVLPFSVNTELLERTFGDSTLVVHYNGHNGSTLLLCQHYHQMIVAGTPVFIRPSMKWWQADGTCLTKDTLYNVTFDGISYGKPTYTTDSNDEWQISNQTTPSSTVESKLSGQYYMKGSYFQSTLSAGCYVLGFTLDNSSNASDASFYSVAEGYKLGGCRAWLEPTSSSAVKLTSVSFNGVTDFDDDETTGIIGIMTDDGTSSASRTTSAAYNDNVYNVNGQLVRTADQGTDGLPAGIYIVNGKKVIIK